MIIKPYSFNGTLLNSTDYETSIPRASALAQGAVNLSYVKRAGADPVYSGKDFQPVSLNLEIYCLHSYTTLQEQLNTLFDVHDETPRLLVVQDTEDTSAENPKRYYVYATTKQVLGGHDGAMVTVTLGLDDPVWKSVTENSQTWTITASGQTTDVTANGNADSYPTYEVEVTGYPGSGYIYNRYVKLVPQNATYAYPNRPVELVADTDNIGLDTAALVAANKALATGDDFRVLVNGIEVDRWFGGAGFNTTDTKVWINLDIPIQRSMYINAAMGSSDTVTSIACYYYGVAAYYAQFLAFPNAGRFVIDTEEFSYTGKTISSTVLTFTGVTRSTRNSSAGAHAQYTLAYLMPYDINIIYGSSDATAPIIDDTKKPILDLTNSHNTSFAYTQFSDLARKRSAIWSPEIVSRTSPTLSLSNHYTGVNNGGDTDPSEVMGQYVIPYQSGGVYKPETTTIRWFINIPDGVSAISHSYERYQGNTTWVGAGLYTTAPNRSWYLSRLWATATSTDFGTWLTGSDATTDITIPAGYTLIAYYLYGSVRAIATDTCYLGITAATLTLTSKPTMELRAEQNNYYFNVILTNQTTSDTLQVKYPLRIDGKKLYIDTDPDYPTAKFDGQTVNGAITLGDVRADWLSLAPGSNTLAITSDFMGNVTLTIKWRDRMNLL